MLPRRTRRRESHRGRRWGWIAVLGVSLFTVVAAGCWLVTGSTVGGSIPVTSQLAEPGPGPSPAPAGGTAAAERVAPSFGARSSARTEAALAGTTEPSWRTRSAAIPTPPSVIAPTRLSVPRLGLSMPIRPTGVNSQGEMAMPAHPTVLGWYEFGATPASGQGSVVLGGHVDSFQYGTGPLVELAQLRAGDQIVVAHHGGTTNYRVLKVQRIAKKSLDTGVIFDRGGPAVLRILTCGGPYEPRRGGYQDNLVVSATPVR